MEDVGTILMDMDAFDFSAMQVPAQMRALVDDQAPLSPLVRKMGKGGAVKA